MTAEVVFAILILACPAIYLAGEASGRRHERRVRDRMRRRVAEQAYDDLTIGLAYADPDLLADNERWSRRGRLEVVR